MHIHDNRHFSEILKPTVPTSYFDSSRFRRTIRDFRLFYEILPQIIPK